MRPEFVLALFLSAALATAAAAAPPRVHVELNTVESTNNQCRVTFVVENRAKEPVESFKLNSAIFNQDKQAKRQVSFELGPMRGGKTIVKTFALDGGCSEIGAILVNDVTCSPGTPDACLDGLELSSRMKDMRLYK
jgi:hypothetical protein